MLPWAGQILFQFKIIVGHNKDMAKNAPPPLKTILPQYDKGKKQNINIIHLF